MSDAKPATGATTPRIEEGELKSGDGTPLHFRHAGAATGTPRARLLVLHGFAEHGGRYVELVKAASARGLDAWSLDLRGHGKSGGPRAFVQKFDDYLVDVAALVERSKRDAAGPALPIFLLGHSMGGLVALRFTQEWPQALRGLILSSPFLALKLKVPAWKRTLATCLANIWPTFGLPSGLDASLLSRNPEVGKLYFQDPLIFHHATTRWFIQTLGAQETALARAGTVAVPALVMHGTADGIADPEGSQRAHTALRGEKELKLWKDLRHEPLNEPEGPEVAAHLLGWIDARLR